jgi:hypothetical protein
MRSRYFILSLIGIALGWAAATAAVLNTNHAPPIAPLSGMILYQSAAMHFVIAHPPKWSIDPNYVDSTMGPGKEIHGVAFTISEERTKGTNLASDTSLGVLTLPGACDASRFADNPQDVKTVTEAGRTYSYATAQDAGAGNRYEETIYALQGTSPCLAIRYFVHYHAIENYAPGVAKAFDRDALMKTFGRMRRSLAIMK